MMIIFLFLAITPTLGTYVANFIHRTNTTCEEKAYRAGYVMPYNCSIDNPSSCQSTSQQNVPKTILCLESMDNITFSHVQIVTHGSGDTTCDTPSDQVFIIRQNMCEDQTTFTCTSEAVTIYWRYNNTECTGEPANTYTYPVGECVANSHYLWPVNFECITV